MPRHALIIGCGYTGRRTAALLLRRGWEVTATTRNPDGLAELRELGATVLRFDVSGTVRLGVSAARASVLLSVPTLRCNGSLDEPTPRIVSALEGSPRHVAYLSTTGVYGATSVVNATTPAAPQTQRQRLRLLAENAVRSQPCPSLVLRPAAIYGPGRGIHSAMQAGRFRLARDKRRYVSRIHVDDLAKVTAAAMEHGIEGVYPVADRLPAPSRDVALFCAELLKLQMPPAVPNGELSETRRSDRRVDGTALLSLLGLRLMHPTYREGIRASVAAEQAA